MRAVYFLCSALFAIACQLCPMTSEIKKFLQRWSGYIASALGSWPGSVRGVLLLAFLLVIVRGSVMLMSL